MLSEPSSEQEFDPPNVYNKSEENEEVIIDIEELSITSPIPISTDYKRKSSSSSNLVVDLGSYQCRAGWSDENLPRFSFESVVSRFKERGTKTSSGNNKVLVGCNALNNASARGSLRTPFDNDIINTPEYAEHIFDYIFLNLGVDGPINTPVLLTEKPANLVYSRNALTELMFEGYQIPKLSYGIDSVFSYYYNNGSKMDDGIILSSGHHNTYLIPIFDNRCHTNLATRLNYGGLPAADFLLKSLQLKYPTFPLKMTLPQAQFLVHTQTFFASNYRKALRRLGPLHDIKYFNSIDRTIQFPYHEPTAEEKTQEDIERQILKRKEQGERLKLQMEKQRLTKLVQLERELEAFKELKAYKQHSSKHTFIRFLQDHDFEDEEELDSVIQKLEGSLTRARAKEMGIEPQEKQVPNFDLIDVDDAELSDDSKREKRKQKLLKAGYDARERIRAAKEAELAAKAKLEAEDAAFRQRDLEGWLTTLRNNYQNLREKVQLRKKMKEQLNDRRSHASRLRMKSIAMLAKEDQGSLKRSSRRNMDDDDNFGADDADWAVYHNLNNEEDSDADEDELQLAQYKLQLVEYDPSYQDATDLELDQYRFKPTNSFLHRYQFGTYFSTWDEMDLPKPHHQLHLNVERIRVPEPLFQPNLLGLQHASLQQSFLDLMQKVGTEQFTKLVKNVRVGGGFAQIPGFVSKLERSLRTNLPTDIPIQISLNQDPVLDSWKGAANASKNIFATEGFYMDKLTYEEYGHNFTLRHGLGNW